MTPPTIRQGNSGNTVREAQCLLVFRGYSVGPSGIDGIIGPITWNRLRNGCRRPRGPPTSFREGGRFRRGR
ncbi:hypothetical protein IAG44_38730 [Streptomyces roseirectus]|uniref:Peptidoglycan binding-like domain-containing protein n=1 Tax=Streptomyces roseirectus TaxID=2768066 RepID=A0A7H0IPU0_9ACTN|nr:hypothetical protein [Streptomyces roseirectus]QNP74806.1 hypothetical protein IAG44_38730 [Streptomyces roseirectus]